MKNLSLLITLIITLFTSNALAWDPPPSPAPHSAILDRAGVLSSDSQSRLDEQLRNIKESSSNEIGVLILKSLDGEDISDVGYATAKAWGIGASGTDNGVLVVLAIKDRKSRIEVGKGIEGDLPDLTAKDILSDVLRPYMKRGDVEGGLSATITAIAGSIQNNKDNVSHSTDKVSGPTSLTVFLWILFFALSCASIFIIFFSRRADRKMQSAYDRYTTYTPPIFAPLPYDGSYTKNNTASTKKTTTKTESTSYDSSSYDYDKKSSGYDYGSSSNDYGSSFGGGDFGGGGSSGDW